MSGKSILTVCTLLAFSETSNSMTSLFSIFWFVISVYSISSNDVIEFILSNSLEDKFKLDKGNLSNSAKLLSTVNSLEVKFNLVTLLKLPKPVKSSIPAFERSNSVTLSISA